MISARCYVCFVMKLMKENGTLKKLIGIASDIAPVVEEKKTKTKEKDKAGSPAKGKKGKASAAEGERCMMHVI